MRQHKPARRPRKNPRHLVGRMVNNNNEFSNANNRNFANRKPKRLVNYGYKNLYSTKTGVAKGVRARQNALKRAIDDGYRNVVGRLTNIRNIQSKWPKKHAPRVAIIKEDLTWARKYVAARNRRTKASTLNGTVRRSGRKRAKR